MDTDTLQISPATSARQPEPALAIDHLSFSHDGHNPTLDNINLHLRVGEFLSLIGPNGGGKTTLLHLVLGLLSPQKGSIRVLGKPPEAMRGNIGYVPQFSTMQSNFPASVLDLVLMGAARPSLCGGWWSTDGKSRETALEYLYALGLADCASTPVGALSGGQRQRALVARALMGGGARRTRTTLNSQDTTSAAPFLLLLDEPTANIDPEGTFCFYEFLGRLQDNITIIVVSHDLFMTTRSFTNMAIVNRSLTRLNGKELTPENLTLLFGSHLHECPVADLQHADGLIHPKGCTHPSCKTGAFTPAQTLIPTAREHGNMGKSKTENNGLPGAPPHAH